MTRAREEHDGELGVIGMFAVVAGLARGRRPDGGNNAERISLYVRVCLVGEKVWVLVL